MTDRNVRSRRSVRCGWPACWARYARVLALAWRERRQLAAVGAHADELAFLPAALSLQDTPVHPAPRRAA